MKRIKSSNLQHRSEIGVPQGFWNNRTCKRVRRLGLKILDNWHALNRKTDLSVSNRGFCYSTLKEVYPHHNRKPTRVARGYWKDKDTQRDALEKLGEKLGVKQLDDWYAVDAKTVKNELYFITNYYNSSLYNALRELYPQHDWNPFKFSRIPLGYWKDIDAQRDALEKLGKKLGVKELDDWYAVDAAAVKNECGFMSYYNYSLYNVLKVIYPQHDWNPLKFVHVPRGYWKDVSIQRGALEKLGKELGVKKLDDWYAVDAKTVRNKLPFIMNYYNNSLSNALKELYPQHDWDPHKFTRVPLGYWKDKDTQRDALEQVGRKLGVKQLDDWYAVDAATVRNELNFIANYYNSSLYKALKELYPQHYWNPLKFTRTPQGYWKDKDTQRDALEKLGVKLGVKELDDWYAVDAAAVKNELGFIMNYYKNSLCNALKELYPQHNWDPLKFPHIPRGYWTDVGAQRNEMEKLGKELGVKQLDDWYAVDAAAVKDAYFITAYYNSSLYKALKELYPQHDWNPLKFSKVPNGYWQNPNTSKHFRSLFRKWKKQHNIQRLRDWYQLPPEQVKLFKRVAYRIFGSVSLMLREWFPETNWIAEVQGSAPETELQTMLRLVVDNMKLHHRIGQHSVDIFIPEWNLAIEYQGKQHYQQHWVGDFNSQQERDENKAEYLSQQHITLIPISYQWNGTWSQLRSTIRAVRPDLLLAPSKQ